MEHLTDLYATKGIEYLIVIGYLAVLILFWRALARRPAVRRAQRGEAVRAPVFAWFRMPEGFAFHPGHAWARIVEGNRVRVGLDDFAHKLLGVPERLVLPMVGAQLRPGEPGFEVRVRDRAFPVLSPVRGEVVAVNEKALEKPAHTAEDPYGEGWLFEVRAPRPRVALGQLMQGRVARSWLAEATHALQARMGGELGVVVQDGGVPLPGIAWQLDPAHGDELVRELLLVEDEDAYR